MRTSGNNGTTAPWKHWEDEVVMRDYAGFGWQVIADSLTHRTISSIKNRAYVLGIRRANLPKPQGIRTKPTVAVTVRPLLDEILFPIYPISGRMRKITEEKNHSLGAIGRATRYPGIQSGLEMNS